MARNDKIFYENAGVGVYNAAWSTGSRGWVNTNYRQITLEKPATGELKTWLEANAVRLPLEGTWVFKSTPTKCPGDFNINFNSNGGSFTRIYYSEEAAKSDPIRYIASPSGTYLTVYNNGAWEDQAYRVITFTQPVQYQGNEEFVKWFTDNAKEVKAENLYGYKITASTIPITVPDCTLSTNGSEDFEGTNPLFDALFWNSTSGTTFSDDNLRVKINTSVSYMVYRSGGQYVRVSNAYIEETNTAGYSILMAEYTSGYITTSSFVKPARPYQCKPLSSIGNLYFADEPTGDLLTWLNKYATKI